MKKTRRRYDRAFKISVVAELESGKPLAQIAREHRGHDPAQTTAFGVKLRVAYELGIFTRLERKSIIGNNKE